MKRSSLILAILLSTQLAYGWGLELSTENINFGDCELGETCSETVQLVNEGEEHLFVESVDFYGSRAFEVISQCSFILAPGDECELIVEFTPYHKGEFEGRAEIESSEGDSLYLNIEGSAQ